MLLRLFYFIPFWCYQIYKYDDIETYDQNTRYNLIRNMILKANRASHITVDCYGIENLPKQDGYIMFPNHQGLFDGFALFETHIKPFTFVSKKEVKNTFLIGQIIKLLQAQLIDREDIRQSMKVIMTITKEVKEGRNYMIFAEGTRSKNGNEIGEFKGGSFKSAMNAKCPIVPIALIDSFQAFDSNSTKKMTVQIHYMEPLYYEQYKHMKSHEIAQLVESRIQDKINEYTL